MCSHNIHANSGRVDLNCHPKWSIVGRTLLRNLRRKIKCYFVTCTLQLFSGFHFILGLIVSFMYSQFTRNSHINEFCVFNEFGNKHAISESVNTRASNIVICTRHEAIM